MSGSVFINNLDDFIAPSQACVNPLVSSKYSIDNNAQKPGKIVLQNDLSKFEYEEEVKPNLIRAKTADNAKVASVSLNDCLACSGCVTSAETFLIQEQGLSKLLSKLKANDSVVVVIMSPNSRSSVSEFLNIAPSTLQRKLTSILKLVGVDYVLDASSGGDIALIEAREEFLKRYQEGHKTTWNKPQYTTAASHNTINIHDNESNVQDTKEITIETPQLNEQLPVLSSHCPGWVCYAEKTQSQALPYLSTVKSAQQIIGSVLKSILREQILNNNNNNRNDDNDNNNKNKKTSIFTVSIQPCFDKKLEASRRDFYHSDTQEQEIDLVLSTGELWNLLELITLQYMNTTNRNNSVGDDSSGDNNDNTVISGMMDVDINIDNNGSSIHELSDYMSQLETLSPYLIRDYILLNSNSSNNSNNNQIEQLFQCYSNLGTSFVNATDSNSGSGGYTEYLFKYIAEKIYHIDLWNITLQYKEGRNPDIAEIDIKHYLQQQQQQQQNNCNSEDGVTNDSNNNSICLNHKSLKFGRSYGFRNIQSTMIKLRKGQCDLDYIEIMACPSGCNNGGGQLKAKSLKILEATAVAQQQVQIENQLQLQNQDSNRSNNSSSNNSSSNNTKSTKNASSNNDSNSNNKKETPQDTKDRVKRVEEVFHRSITTVRAPDDSPLVKLLYSSQYNIHAPLSENALKLFHTRYHAVPKLEIIAPLATKW